MAALPATSGAATRPKPMERICTAAVLLVLAYARRGIGDRFDQRPGRWIVDRTRGMAGADVVGADGKAPVVEERLRMIGRHEAHLGPTLATPERVEPGLVLVEPVDVARRLTLLVPPLVKRSFLRESELEGIVAAAQRPASGELVSVLRKASAKREVSVDDPPSEVFVAFAGTPVVDADFSRNRCETDTERDDERDHASNSAGGECVHGADEVLIAEIWRAYEAVA